MGFTCRVKVESPSAPYGSATDKSGAAGLGGSSAGRPRAVDDDDSRWHPVLCHRPLSVSVFSHEEADAIKLQAQVGVSVGSVCVRGGQGGGFLICYLSSFNH